jgi:hypothetical protein
VRRSFTALIFIRRPPFLSKNSAVSVYILCGDILFRNEKNQEAQAIFSAAPRAKDLSS